MLRDHARTGLGLLLLSLALASCRTGAGAPTLSDAPPPIFDHATITITPARGSMLTLTVEVADTPEARAQGLMGREHLADDAGMAFRFDSPSTNAFWMKDTKIPLAIAFWDEHGRIVDIKEMTPCTAEPCPRYVPRAPYVGALEVNPEVLARVGIGVGDTIHLVAHLATPAVGDG